MPRHSRVLVLPAPASAAMPGLAEVRQTGRYKFNGNYKCRAELRLLWNS